MSMRHHATRPTAETPGLAVPRAEMVRKLLLACGVVSSALYVAVDILLTIRWQGYSYTDQTISELFAVDAPTRPLAVPLFLFYAVLVYAFGAGIWLSAGGRRALYVVAAAVVTKEILGVVATVIAPMHMRGLEATMSDTAHGLLTMLGGFCYLTAMGFAATVFGKGFRVYSIATMLLLVLGAVMAGLDIASVGANQPTPWMGAWERLNAYATMLWLAVLAVTLLRGRPGNTKVAWDGRRRRS